MPQTNVTPQFDSDSKLKKMELPDYETLLKMLVNNRVDVVVGNHLVYGYLLKKMNKQDEVLFPGFLLKKIDNQFHISRKSKFINKLDVFMKATKTLEDNGTFNKITKKYID
jgi:ABC-type amino acid transport substrate-binding protein